MKKIDPRLIVIIGVLFVSFSSIFIKYSTSPSLIIATYRLGITVLMILPSVLIKKREEIINIDKKSLVLCIFSGVFLALHFATWITSIKYTSIASSTVLVNIHPIFIVIGSFFILKDIPGKRGLVSMIITLVGSILISLGDSSLGSNVLLGDILAILGAFFVAGYMMIGRIVRQKLSVISYIFLVYLSCTITLLLMTIASGIPLYPYPPRELLIFLALAVFSTILGHSIFNWALEYVKPTFISTAVLGEPLFATIWAVVLFGEIPKLWHIIGSLIIIYGIYLFIQQDDNSKTVGEKT